MSKMSPTVREIMMPTVLKMIEELKQQKIQLQSMIQDIENEIQRWLEAGYPEQESIPPPQTVVKMEESPSSTQFKMIPSNIERLLPSFNTFDFEMVRVEKPTKKQKRDSTPSDKPPPKLTIPISEVRHTGLWKDIIYFVKNATPSEKMIKFASKETKFKCERKSDREVWIIDLEPKSVKSQYPVTTIKFQVNEGEHPHKFLVGDYLISDSSTLSLFYTDTILCQVLHGNGKSMNDETAIPRVVERIKKLMELFCE